VTQITCAKCEQVKDAMPSPPLAGERGIKVQQNVCADCWQAWLEQSTLLINHYGIQVADPAQRRQLYPIMAEFLNLKDFV
jgi:Fe-S cluster biosynthesis and repair protein YggX